MRDNVRAFVEIAASALQLEGPVYEFGSYQVPGHARGDLRDLFPGRRYIGCDLREGPGVDQIEDLGCLSLADHSARTILCLDTLEHVFEARRAVEEMIRVLAPGGVLLLAAPMDFRIHQHPDDYWRLTPTCMARLLAPLEATVVGSQGVENFPHTVLGIGCKTPVGPRFGRGVSRLLEEYQAWLARQSAHAWPWRLKRLLAWTRSKGERRRLAQFHTARFSLHLPPSSWPAVLTAPVPEPAFKGSRIDVFDT
jgi:SAM-dependent methyltransferase